MDEDDEGAMARSFHHEAGFLRSGLAQKSSQKGRPAPPEKSGERVGQGKLDVADGGERVAFLVHEEARGRARPIDEPLHVLSHFRETVRTGDDFIRKGHRGLPGSDVV
jgi:hypothetical protein